MCRTLRTCESRPVKLCRLSKNNNSKHRWDIIWPDTFYFVVFQRISNGEKHAPVKKTPISELLTIKDRQDMHLPISLLLSLICLSFMSKFVLELSKQWGGIFQGTQNMTINILTSITVICELSNIPKVYPTHAWFIALLWMFSTSSRFTSSSYLDVCATHPHGSSWLSISDHPPESFYSVWQKSCV